jgi:hypothetical protein
MLGNRIVADYELVNIFSSKTCRISKIGQKWQLPYSTQQSLLKYNKSWGKNGNPSRAMTEKNNLT